MSALNNQKTLFQTSCSTNSEPFALQNIGDMMSPEFSENCILIIDPSIPVHHKAYVIIDFNDELYFRQYLEENGRKFLRCVNSIYADIELNNNFEVRGCISQQKQRKQKSLHYYLPNDFTGEIEFTESGKEKKLSNKFNSISSR